MEVVEYLSEELHVTGNGIDLRIVEPFASELPSVLQDVRGVRLTTEEEALDADLLLMLVDHRVFHEIPVERYRGKKIIDTRGIWR